MHKTKIPENHFSSCLVTAAEHHVTSEEEGDEIQLEMLEVTLGTLDLRESEICPSRHQRRRRRRKKEQRRIQNDGKASQDHYVAYPASFRKFMFAMLIAEALFLKFPIPV